MTGRIGKRRREAESGRTSVPGRLAIAAVACAAVASLAACGGSSDGSGSFAGQTLTLGPRPAYDSRADRIQQRGGRRLP
jgi:hypothetical protein